MIEEIHWKIYQSTCGVEKVSLGTASLVFSVVIMPIGLYRLIDLSLATSSSLKFIESGVEGEVVGLTILLIFDICFFGSVHHTHCIVLQYFLRVKGKH